MRLSQHYRQLSDTALLDLARQTPTLTDIAQQVLAQEITARRLPIPPQPPAAPQRPAWQPEDPGSIYAEDRELIDFCTVFSLADALQLQSLLDMAGIPIFIGPEKASSVESVTSNFSKGLMVRIMRVGLPWAYRAAQEYFPHDIPPQEIIEEPDNLAIHCPRCRSTEVVFEDLQPGPETSQGEPASKFKWTCDLCGHAWEDDGLLSRA